MPAAKPAHVRARALALLDQGWSLRAIARELGVHHTTVAWWRDGGGARRVHERKERDRGAWLIPWGREPRVDDAWAFLLGLYLGDGYVDPLGRLRIFLDRSYPGIIDEADGALRTVGVGRVWHLSLPGCRGVAAGDLGWAGLLPTGRGRKHEYRVRLTGWQELAQLTRPHLLVRGLLFSDGCRFTNRVRVRGRDYAYPCYDFSNRSPDVHQVFRDCLDALGIPWRPATRGITTRIARRPGVATLDLFVGAKR